MSNEDIDRLKQQTFDKFKIIISNSKKAGTYNFPHNLGLIILGYASTDNNTVANFVNRYKSYMLNLLVEGVSNQDILVWWNQPDVSRRLVYFDDAEYALSYFSSFEVDKDKNKTQSTVYDQLKRGRAEFLRLNPIFKAFEYEHSFLKEFDFQTPEDFPLPYELKERVLKYHEKIQLYGGLYIEDIMKFTSYNAFIRSLIRKSIV
jgi:hypothetical protein